MDVSPMSMTPSGSRDDLLAAAPTPGAAADTDTTPSVSDAELANQGDFTYDHEHDYDTEPPALGASYFRRTSLAIAAARRFTLYEAAAATPGSPIAPVSPIAAASASAHIQAPAHPSIQFQGNIQSQHRSQTAQSQSVPRAVHRSPPSPTRGLAALGSSLFSRGGGVPARYTSPLATPNEEDEERLVGSGVGGDAGVGVRRAHAANVASHHAQAQAQSQAQGYTTAHVHGQGQRPSTRRRRSSVVQARYRWLSGGGSNTGDEPGVDVRSARDQEAYGHLKAKTHVTVVDYTCNPDMEDANVRADFDGDRLREWLNSSGGQRPLKDGQPAGVRWIHVSGLNWEVVKTLTLKYGLHPLAVEDALRSVRHPRSKCDFYANHLYLQILVYHIHAPDRAALARIAEGIPDGVAVGSDEEEDSNGGRDGNWRRPAKAKSRSCFSWGRKNEGKIRLPEGMDAVFDDPTPEKSAAHESHRIVVERLSAEYMVPIRRGILSIFMLRDGTLISLSAHKIHEALAPIYERLEDEHSLLRRSNDVSMLAHALLDVSVDLSVEITSAFEKEILKVEAKALVQAHLELVRHLHIIQAQILRFRRQLASLLHACYVLRDQDVARAQAAGQLTQPRARASVPDPTQPGNGAGSMGSVPAQTVPVAASAESPTLSTLTAARPHSEIDSPLAHRSRKERHHISGSLMPVFPHEGTTPPPPPPAPAVQVQGQVQIQGWFSPQAKVYMNDVIDHLEMVVSASEQFVGTCDHLTDYCFNVLSFQTNNSMERLSIVTVVFLPLTFIASYFGMNFTNFPALENPDSYFWRVAAPATVSFFLIFSFSYLSSAWETFMRRMARYRDVKKRQ